MHQTPRHPPKTAFRRQLATMLLALAVAAPAAAVEEESLPVFVEHIDVRAVDIEVVVKKAGKLVHGLQAEDFRVSLDGETVAIDDFAEVRDGRSAAGPVTTRYLVFIDDDFSIPAQRNSVLRRFGRELDRLAPQDRMAVVAWDGSRVDLLSGWQPGGEDLRKVVEQARERPAYGLKRQSEWGRLQSALSYRDRLPGSGGRSFSSIGFSGSTRPGPIGSRSADELSSRVGHLSAALASTMRGFAQPAGRRVVIFMSGALPLVDAAIYERGGVGRFAHSAEARRYFGSAVSTANRLGYTIYPVDLGGSKRPGSLGVDAEISRVAEAEWRRELAREDEYLSEDALLFLAESTGGRALLDGARFRALEAIVDDTRSYYRLGLTPSWRGEDEELRLEVEWLGGGGRVEIRTRRGFLDLSAASRVTMAVESAHLFDVPLPDETQFSVEVGTIERTSRTRMLVPLTLRFPLDGMTFLGEDSGKKARLELRIAATDDRGDTAEIPVVPLTVEERENIRHVTWQTKLELRHRPHRLLLAIHDTLGERVLAQRLEVDPPP